MLAPRNMCKFVYKRRLVTTHTLLCVLFITSMVIFYTQAAVVVLHVHVVWGMFCLCVVAWQRAALARGRRTRPARRKRSIGWAVRLIGVHSKEQTAQKVGVDAVIPDSRSLR